MKSDSRMTVRMAAALLLSGAVAVAGTVDLSWSTVDGGGGTSVGGLFELSGTLGQHDASEPLVGGDFSLIGGFWSGAGDVIGDCSTHNWDHDSDGDVDLGDFSQFSLCFGGSLNPPAGTCPPGVDADCDNDSDVDQTDFYSLSLAFTGPM